MPQPTHHCFPRRRFSSEASAHAAAARLANTQGVKRYVVACAKCGGWHLTGEGAGRG